MMHAIDRVKEDHQRLSETLSVLEAALSMDAEGWVMLREACFSISQQLRRHITREMRLVAACHRERGRVAADELQWLSIEHQDVSQRLQLLNGLLRGEPAPSLDAICPDVPAILVTLRHQMYEQEIKLFPFLELVQRVQHVFGTSTRIISGEETGQAMQEVMPAGREARRTLPRATFDESSSQEVYLPSVA